jgi:hypothetical protein
VPCDSSGPVRVVPRTARHAALRGERCPSRAIHLVSGYPARLLTDH